MRKHFTSSVIIIKDEKILLLWHRKLNTWLYPGGHLEENETPDETAIREVKEETSLNVRIIQNNNFEFNSSGVRVLNNPYVIMEEETNDSDGKHYHIDMVYLAIPIEEKNVEIREEESRRFAWFSYEEIQNIDLFPNLKALLEKIFEDIKKGKIKIC